MAGPVLNLQKRYTYKDYATWSDDERWEIIDGVPYCMSPAPNLSHQEILIRLSYQIFDYLKDKKCKVFAAPADVLLDAVAKNIERYEDSENIVQPDIFVVCDKTKLTDKFCKGAPDFIIEIMSPTSGVRDQIEKVELYERFGVREYWIVQTEEQCLIIHALQNNGKFNAPVFIPGKGKRAVQVIEGLEIDLDMVFPAATEG